MRYSCNVRDSINVRDIINVRDFSWKQRPIMTLPTALYKLKTTEMRSLLSSVSPLTIVNVPTWETQHGRYSDERYALLQSFVNETILTALKLDFEKRHGVKLNIMEDDTHYMLFSVTPVEPELTNSPKTVANPFPKSEKPQKPPDIFTDGVQTRSATARAPLPRNQTQNSRRY